MSRCIKSERCTASHPTYPHADRILKGEGDPRSPDASGKIRGDAVFPPPGRLPPPSATRVPFGEWGDRFPVMADVPRGLQDRPRGLQDGPMTAQEAPKTAPRGPQDGPRGLQDAEDGLQDGLQDGADGPKVPTCTLTKRPRRPRRTQTQQSTLLLLLHRLPRPRGVFLEGVSMQERGGRRERGGVGLL